MKSILKKVAGLALVAALALGMAGCSSESESNMAAAILLGNAGISGTPAKQNVAAPTFSVASGEVTSGTSVTISCATEGAKIYYTKDGSAPTSSSTEYTVAISVTEAVTLKAIAVKDGMNDSAVVSAAYTIAINDDFVEINYPVGNFFISPTELTYTEWYEVYQWAVTNGYIFQNLGREGSNGTDGAAPTKGRKQPVTYVSWRDAVVWCNAASEKAGLTPVYEYEGSVLKEAENYCSWGTNSKNTTSVSEGNGKAEKATVNITANGYRLPTEAEWEYAAKGGADYTYSGSNDIDKVAWYSGNRGGKTTHDVGTKDANGYGLHDMSGNVWEWCWDWNIWSYVFSSYRVLRGGCWGDNADYCTVSSRSGELPYGQHSSLGFRVVRSSSKLGNAGSSGTPAKQTVAAPTFSVASGEVTSGKSVTISCATEGAKIYYTTDGSTPTASSTAYTVAISVTEAVTLKAIAVKSGMNDSAVVSAAYTIAIDDFVEITYSEGDFYISPTELTYTEWYEVYQWAVTNGYIFQNLGREGSNGTDGAAPTKGRKQPVTYVSWRDAVVWCNAASEKAGLTPVYEYEGSVLKEAENYNSWGTNSENTTNVSAGNGKAEKATVNTTANGYRLPTEAEWKYAARGGADYKYSGSNDIDKVAWYSGNSGSRTHDVGTKDANEYGLHDMSGNVMEWCHYAASGSSSSVCRGGSWYDYAGSCTVSYYGPLSPYNQSDWLGFRVVRNAN